MAPSMSPPTAIGNNGGRSGGRTVAGDLAPEATWGVTLPSGQFTAPRRLSSGRAWNAVEVLKPKEAKPLGSIWSL